MQIRLIKLNIENFKGTKQRTVDFNGKDTDILGDNASGKSTIYDAFSWLLFNKNSAGESKFDMKPYGMERPSVTVEGILDIDGKRIELKKTLTETYTTKRGSEESTFTGHSTDYWINSIPKKVGEYTAFIDAIVSEDTFKRLTNANYFLSMKKPEMRRILLDMAGNISDDEVAGTNTDLQTLVLSMQEKGYSIDDLMTKTKEQIKLFTKDQSDILPRIDEVRKSIPTKEQDYTKIEQGIAEGNKYIAKIDAKLHDTQSRVSDVAKKYKELLSLKTQIEDLKREKLAEKNEDRNKDVSLKGQLATHCIALRGQIEGLTQRENNLNEQLNTIQSNLVNYGMQWKEKAKEKKEEFAVQFTPIEYGSSNCDKCGQLLDMDNIDKRNADALARFTESKAKLLGEIEKSLETIKLNGSRESTLKVNMELQIKDVQESKTKLETELAMATSRLKVIEDKISDTLPTLEIDLTGDMQFEELSAKVKELETETDTDDSEAINKLLENKRTVQEQMETLKSQLAMRGSKEKAETRIAELTAEGKRLAGLIADEKKTQYTCEQFLKTKATMLESTINALFSNLSFRLFDIQINEGIKDDCTAMVNGGVEYKDASHSEQIRAQMDIVNCFQRNANIYCPLFVDNSEACTYLREMDCQVIRLIVSAKDKVIRIQERTSEGDAENRSGMDFYLSEMDMDENG